MRQIRRLLRVDEHSEDSFIGRDGFFFMKLVHAKLSRFDFAFLFKFNSFPLVKGRQTALSNSKIVNVTKNVIDF